MSLFANLLSRLTFLNEAGPSPMERILPGFQKQARGLAASKGASSGTREGRLAMLNILYDLDIIDDAVIKQFKNDPSVSRMVDYFEANGIAKKIKSHKEEIQKYIKDQLENKVSFTTGNRTDTAQQRYELNKLNVELKAAKKVARIERKKESASALNVMSQVVDTYDDLVGSIQHSYSSDYMIELVASKDCDLNDIDRIITYIKRFVKESDIEVDGRSIDGIFDKESKLAKLVERLGAEKVEAQIADDLESYGGVGVVIHKPDIQQKKNMIGNLVDQEEEEGMNGQEDEEITPESLNDLGISTPRYTGGKIPPFSKGTVTEGSVLNYMSEQKVYSSPKPIVESLSFRDKFKPKTDKQLAELRSYGM